MMASRGESVSLTFLLLIVMTIPLDGIPRAVEAQQFSLTHRFAHLKGSSAKSGDKGMSVPDYYEMLKAHDRRRLAAVVDFPLKGDDSVFITGSYYTQITLGSPPSQHYVIVDTGSDLTWVNCAPCVNCPLRSDLKGVTLTQYDPSLSSTDNVLSCASSNCRIASYGRDPICTIAPTPGACSYTISYFDGSGTDGYIISDVMTFNQVSNSSRTNGTANVYFGCGYNQTGNLNSELRAVDGIMGFGQQVGISIPTQLADQKKTGRVFAHCLQGDNLGGGIIVIGNILEPDIVYTPLVPRQAHYEVVLQNIAVNGMNITTPASFDSTLSSGTVMDSGATLAYLVQPAYDQFIIAISSNAPAPAQQLQQNGGDPMTCFVYSGSITATFPKVQLFFDGGAVMNLGPKNYLIAYPLQSGETAYCIGWRSSTSYTIFGDIVLKDQLVVYDNDKQRLGWKPFDCTKPIAVGTPNGTDSMNVLPPGSGLGSGSGSGSGSGAQDPRTRMSTFLLSSCLAFAFLQTLL